MCEAVAVIPLKVTTTVNIFVSLLYVRVAVPDAVEALAGVSLAPLIIALNVTLGPVLFLQEAAVNNMPAKTTNRTCLTVNFFPGKEDGLLKLLLYVLMIINI